MRVERPLCILVVATGCAAAFAVIVTGNEE